MGEAAPGNGRQLNAAPGSRPEADGPLQGTSGHARRFARPPSHAALGGCPRQWPMVLLPGTPRSARGAQHSMRPLPHALRRLVAGGAASPGSRPGSALCPPCLARAAPGARSWHPALPRRPALPRHPALPRRPTLPRR
eukprot:2948670-Alexandrium_andersonii.AAC.1